MHSVTSMQTTSSLYTLESFQL